MPRWPRNDYLKYYYARNYGNVDAQMPLELRAPGVDVHADLQRDVIAAGVGFLAQGGVLAGDVEFAGDVQHALVDGGLEARHGQRPVLDRQRAFDRAVG